MSTFKSNFNKLKLNVGVHKMKILKSFKVACNTSKVLIIGTSHECPHALYHVGWRVPHPHSLSPHVCPIKHIYMCRDIYIYIYIYIDI